MSIQQSAPNETEKIVPHTKIKSVKKPMEKPKQK